ncbi:hypothetical protein HYX02_07930 [Candidatus Woesearchaeota archaeon]|nr:hypothetical protein [Candidatus Woesearchaeota archaeon]
MKKRGQLLFEAIVVMLLFAIPASVFYQVGISLGNRESYYKLAVARDMALSIDLMYALPGDVSYVYPNDVSSYNIGIRDRAVRVYKPEEIVPTMAIYPFAGVDTDEPVFFISGKKYVKLEKINGKLKITGVDE